MKQQKYRFNRKDGRIYLDREGELIDVGDSLKAIILWASEPTFGKPFGHLSAQHWVQLTFINEAEDWCYAVLGNGATNALFPWLAYRKAVEKHCTMDSVITTIGFEKDSEEYSYFDYKFTGCIGKLDLPDRVRAIKESSKFPVAEPLGLLQ